MLTKVKLFIIASFLEVENSILLTGDKSCLNALFREMKDLSIREVQDKLLGRVICFERLLYSKSLEQQRLLMILNLSLVL